MTTQDQNTQDQAGGVADAASAADTAPKTKRARSLPTGATSDAAENAVEVETIPQEQARLAREASMYKIVLEPNANIPPSGQFFSVNGNSFLILPGVEATVPEYLLEVLDNAIEHRPVFDEKGNVSHYDPHTRYPYRLVRK